MWQGILLKPHDFWNGISDVYTFHFFFYYELGVSREEQKSNIKQPLKRLFNYCQKIKNEMNHKYCTKSEVQIMEY